MKAKILLMLCVSALALILLAGVASADMVLSPSTITKNITQGTTSTIVNFNLAHDGAVATNYSISWYGQATQGTWTLPSLTTLNVNESHSLSATLGSIPTSFSGTITGSITVNHSTGSPTETLTVTINVAEEESTAGDFCSIEFGDLDSNLSNEGDLKVTIKDVKNNGMGEDDEWYPSDSIDVEVKVENDGNDDIDNIVLEWGLWSEETDEWVIEITEEDDFDLGDGKDNTVTFTMDLYDDLNVDLEDLEDGNYVLYVRAVGEVDDDNDTETCEFDSEDVTVLVSDELVILNDLMVTGTPFCGSTVQITADILNIGSEDQEGVYIEIYNAELGILETAEVGDIDAFEDNVLDFEFTIPSNTAEKRYYLSIDVYNEDDDIYENENDDESKYSVALDVSGNCNKVSNAAIYASLESGGKAGGELEIKATITNNDDSQQTFTISLADYSTWAELVSIEPEEVTLSPGASKDVIITLNVNSDAEENQNLNVVLTSDNGESTSQPLAVTVEKGFSFSGMFGDNAYLWGIALVNIVLIVVIVIVAVKATRR